MDGRWLYGPISTPQSSWVAAFGFLYVKRGKQGSGLAVQFKDGVGVWYPGTDSGDYQKLRKARSKGRWVHKYVYEEPYEFL